MAAERPSFVVEDQSEVIGFLERRLAPATRIDTHGAVVFLTDERAYKLKRAVKFPYMDFSTADRRWAMCQAEIDINRRLAPEVYLGVAPVRRAGPDRLALGEVGESVADAVDSLVVMRRFDDSKLFDRLADQRALTIEMMGALGARIARFHDGLPPIRDGFGRPDDYRQSVAADIRQMREQGKRLDPAMSEALADAMPRSLEPFVDLVARRVEEGAIRRCHGDLHLRNIVLIEGKPVPFDAIEFSERIANIDVLYDLAFALMDLCHRGLRALANRLLNEWLWRIGELEGAPHDEALALLPMFLARRASIRAYVDSSVTAVSGADNEPARAYQRAALAFLQPAPPRLLAIGGLSGSGKTTKALQLAPEIGRAPGAVAVRSDVERKRLAGIALEERMPAGSYTPEASAAVYGAMMARAERLLRAGHSVVLDAVFARPEERQAAEAVAATAGVPFEGMWLDVPKDIAQARVAARKADASDATPAVVERQFGYELGEIRWKRR
ncbi:bifunctional aminoglycoside phosphotransferase/ATP-binding protein [Enhydrobacter sp.]|jgi:aminoglycoside phosphotransferase family enzyme/predicted kinase|uniref:bifunctional aminoglycoside phosphotransferase/ATP-binding protein n=1 Tax=Enhydrobacter sp. TaxID=1894999 RepID=UPI002602C6B4|nr:bifunctional aminoglycoside phosphotransferase/ATP-binding protein [Enhydrobacter sp.]WIM13065.1 MAG: AAA family ATPase [Enhydrobacter sp.]